MFFGGLFRSVIEISLALMHDFVYEMRFQRPDFPLFKVIRVAKKVQ